MTLPKLLTAAALAVAVSTGPAFAADALSPQTRENLQTAMHGEAFANLKYRRYAEVAREAAMRPSASIWPSRPLRAERPVQ